MIRRNYHFKTYIGPNDDDYIHGTYKISYFNIISEFLMLKVLRMNYYWDYSKSLGFEKVWDIDYLMRGE